jgi:hypothetical protein
MRKWLFAIWMLCLPIMAAEAVILREGDAGTQTTGDGAGDGWDYVGSIGGASGVYLGSYETGYWVLTAAHVGLGTFTLDGIAYPAVPGSGVQIGGADLFVFRLESGPPSLGPIEIASATPTIGQEVTMIGNGVNRAATETYWTPLWEETTNPGLGIYKGYKWGSGSPKRWGTNTVSGTGTGEFGMVFQTTFQSVSLSAQATSGDSGGGVFVQPGGQWQLAGVMVAVSSFLGQPGSTSIYQQGSSGGNSTIMVDVSYYRDEILAVVPEVGTGWLLLVATAAWVLVKKGPAGPRGARGHGRGGRAGGRVPRGGWAARGAARS